MSLIFNKCFLNLFRNLHHLKSLFHRLIDNEIQYGEQSHQEQLSCLTAHLKYGCQILGKFCTKQGNTHNLIRTIRAELVGNRGIDPFLQFLLSQHGCCMTDGSNLGIDRHMVHHLQKGNYQCGVSSNDICCLRQIKVRFIHNIQQFNIIDLQRSDLCFSLRHRHTVECPLIELIAALCLQLFKDLLCVNISGTKLNVRINLRKINSCLRNINLLMIEQNIIHQKEHLTVIFKAGYRKFADCKLISAVL